MWWLMSLSRRIYSCPEESQASQVVLVVKTPPAKAGDASDMGSILGREDPME